MRRTAPNGGGPILRARPRGAMSTGRREVLVRRSRSSISVDDGVTGRHDFVVLGPLRRPMTRSGMLLALIKNANTVIPYREKGLFASFNLARYVKRENASTIRPGIPPRDGRTIRVCYRSERTMRLDLNDTSSNITVLI